MYYTYILYWLLLLITITATFDKKYQFKLFKDSYSKNIHDINEYGTKRLCDGRIIESSSQQIKNYPKPEVGNYQLVLFSLAYNNNYKKI